MTNAAISTTELCDQKDKAHFLSRRLASFGGRSRFHGEVIALKCFEDGSRIKEAITHPGGQLFADEDGIVVVSKADMPHVNVQN